MRLTAVIKSAENQSAAYNQGRQTVYNATGKYKNACAATLSAWMQIARIFQPGEVYMWTSDVVRELMEKHGFIRVNEPFNVKPGDVVVTLDRNHNNAPDHVYLVASMGSGNYVVGALDNTHEGKQYGRNLRAGEYTPMDYALRQPPDYPMPDEHVLESLRKIRDAVHAIYKEEKHIPAEARKALNTFANNSFLDPVRDN